MCNCESLVEYKAWLMEQIRESNNMNDFILKVDFTFLYDTEVFLKNLINMGFSTDVLDISNLDGKIRCIRLN